MNARTTTLPAARSDLTDPPTMGGVVTVMSPRGGVGKTTIAANLAVRCAAQLGGWAPRVALADFDVAFGSCAQALGAHAPRSIADLGPAPDVQDVRAVLVELEAGVDVLSAAPDPVAAESIDDTVFSATLRRLAAMHAITVVDTGAGLSEPALAALDVSDLVVLPVTGDPAAVAASASVIAVLDRLGVRGARLAVVANRCGAPHTLTPREIGEQLGVAPVAAVPFSDDVVLAARRGRVLAWDWPDHPVPQSIDRLANLVLAQCPVPQSPVDGPARAAAWSSIRHLRPSGTRS